MEYEFWVRPYNAEGSLLVRAMSSGFNPAAVVVDAGIAAYFPNFRAMLQKSCKECGAVFVVDPTTHKLRLPYFRKRVTYQRLPYYEGEVPSLSHLEKTAPKIAAQVLATEQDLGSNFLLSPYLLLDENQIPGGPLTKIQGLLYDAFFQAVGEGLHPRAFMCLSLTSPALALPETLEAVREWVHLYGPRNAYLIIYEFSMDVSDEEQRGMKTLLKTLRDSGLERIIYNHGPAWVHFLKPFGLTGFASGINFMATQELQYLRRQEPIEGIAHNYYLQRKFMKVELDGLHLLLDNDVIEPCMCPACVGSAPLDVAGIRSHYLFARQEEVHVINRTDDVVRLLSTWINESEDVVAQCSQLEVPLIGIPPYHRMRKFLE